MFEFFPNNCKPDDQASPHALFTPLQHLSNKKWTMDSDVRSVQPCSRKETAVLEEDAADDARVVDQVTPPCKPQASNAELECPPTCPLPIPPSPLPSTPCIIAPAAANTDNHLQQQPPTAFDSVATPSNATDVPMLLEHDEPRSSSAEAPIQEQPCSSSSRETVPAQEESAMEKELAEVRAKLAKVEVSRDSIARDLGHQKGSVAKLEGTVSSLDKRLKAQLLENQNLKARLAEAERQAAVASVTADVTPDRCRSSVRAMHEETLRAQEVARQREAQVHKLQQLMAHEAEEAAQLQAFESQERTMLLASQASLQQAMLEQSSHVAQLLQQQGQSREREAALEAELQMLRKEVWDTKNQNIEIMAEAQHIHGVASAAQAAAIDAQQQAAAAREAEARCAAELTTVRDAGVKLFKQIRAVVHALERNLHHFQRVPEVGLSIRQLHDWCAKHGPFWVEKGEEAAAAAEGAAPQLSQGGLSGAHAAGAQTAAPTHAHSSVQAPAGAGDETMTISLGHVMALGAGSTHA